MMNNIDFKIKNLAEIFNGEIIGDEKLKITGISSIENANVGDITFINNDKYLEYIKSTKASAIIINNRNYTSIDKNKTYLLVKDAYTSFALLLTEINKQNILSKKGIENPSFIHESSKISKNVYVGAFSYIGENVKIGNNTKIFPNCYIGNNSVIDENCIVYPGVKIYSGSKIGKNCIFHSNSVIGSDGFGFAPSKNGEYTMIPQIGNVVIKDNVSIGSNTVIDRATLDSTIINSGVKIDNLVQIAHNVTIGKNTVIAALSGIAGSTSVGENNMIGGQVGIVGHLKMGDNVKYAAQSGVTKNSRSGQTLIGFPAVEKDKFVRTYRIIKKLPSIEEKINKIEEILYNLQSK